MKNVIIFFLISFYLNTVAQCVQPTIPSVNSVTNCSGQNSTLTCNGTLNNATNWVWYTGSCGGILVGTGTQLIVSPTVTTTYFVRGEGGCVIPGPCATSSVSVLQSPSISATFNNMSCFGLSNGSISLLVSGQAPFSYNWSPTGYTTANISGLSAAPHTATVTDANGCKTFTTINIFQPNILALNVSPSQTICYGNQASVYAQAIGGTTPYSYTMTNLSNNTTTTIVTPIGMNVSPTLTSTTQFTVSVVDANGCSNGPQTIIANVWPALIASGYSVVACSGDSVTLTANIISAGNGGPRSYNWSNGATSVSAGIIVNFTNTPNTYTVVIDDGCTIPNTSAIFTVNVSACVGINENKFKKVNISFYPNPAYDFLIIESDKELKITLFSVLGREILQSKITNTKNPIDVRALSNGIYYLSIFNVANKKMMTEKILIQH
ncbi:MAG: T9SS type A sorting domain-containing protein [Bacteroidia bacterium]